MTAIESTTDLLLDGRPLLRLVDPTPADLRAVADRLGLAPADDDDASAGGGASAHASPVLVLRYVASLPISGTLRTVGRDDGAFDDDAFVIRAGSRPVAIVPFERIGQPGAEITVVRGTGVPGRLVSLLNLALLGHDRIALHASAVELDGLGIAACGWSGSGKTEAMLGLVHAGGRFVGDEWTVLDAGGRLVGLPERIRIQDWHAAQLPSLRDAIGSPAVLRMRAAAAAERGGRWLGRAPRRVPMIRAVGRGAARVGSRRHVDVPADVLFGPDRRAAATTLDRLVLLETSTDPRIRVEPIDPALVADRLALAHVHHRRELLGWYWQSRFAFPDRRNALLDQIESVERERLAAAFSGRPAIRVEHPHAVDIAALGRAIVGAVR